MSDGTVKLAELIWGAKGLIGQKMLRQHISGKTDRFHCWEWMASFDGPIYPRLGQKIQGIMGLKVQNGLCELQWKKVPLDVLFSTVHRIKTCTKMPIRNFRA